jgi:hypothetical protein
MAARQMMAVITAKRQANSVMRRIQAACGASSGPSGSFHSFSTVPSATAFECGAQANLFFESASYREEIQSQWGTEIETMYDLYRERLKVARQHDVRRAIVAAEAAKEMEDAERERIGRLRIQRAGRNFKIRRNLGYVYQVREEARMMVEDERRDRKALGSKELILRGDIRHFAALDTMITFKEDAPKVMHNLHLFSWNPDCYLVVESLERHRLEELQVKVFGKVIVEGYAEGRLAVLRIPPHLRGQRAQSAKTIQHAYRCFRNRRFHQTVKDVMVLQLMARLQLKSNMRFTVDLERNMRGHIVEEEAAVDFFGGEVFRQFMAQCAREWRAAIRIQSLARGRHVRRHVVPPRMEAYLLRKHQAQKARLRQGGGGHPRQQVGVESIDRGDASAIVDDE